VGLVTELPGPAGSLARGPGARPRGRHPAAALFREGSDVKAGQALFRIDAAPYQATLQAPRPAGARRGQPGQATALAERYKPLVAKTPSASRTTPTPWRRRSRPRPMWPPPGAVQTARINLGYANVTAPISGRIGRALVTEGALVGQGEATPLAVIQQIDPLYVNFTQSASEVLRCAAPWRQGQLKGRAAGAPGARGAGRRQRACPGRASCCSRT
jgi:membrane fusion protein, multidrug efflux system